MAEPVIIREGRERFSDAEYSAWRQRRFDTIVRHFGQEFFQGKTLLELGAGCGHFGQLFHELGAQVTCWEGREANVTQLRELYPHLDAHVKDLDHDQIETDYDIILHQGLLYHLKNVVPHLQNVCAHTRLLILETHVTDLEADEIEDEVEPPEICDSSINGLGTRTTLGYVENRLRENGFHPLRAPDRSQLDCYGHRYNWEPSNSGTKLLRMLWFAEKIDA